MLLAQTKAPPPRQQHGGLKMKVGISGVTLTWTAPLAGSLVIVNRTPCTGTFTPNSGTPNAGMCSQVGAFSTITTTVANATSYTDTNITAGAVYVYNVQVTCTGTGAACPAPYTGTGRSPVSNNVAASIPSVTPPVLPNIFLTETYQSSVGMVYLLVEWRDTPGGRTAYVVFGANGSVLRQGNSSTVSGFYKLGITIPTQTGIVYVCNPAGCVSSTF